ncbi:hypothetical protein N9061_01425 [bacterium]|nr:hypothetical protein [Mariniblastus sp.]MDB4357229.1 hypothetical protein [Mariniblastus sp.]MDB4391974.1 hypothetical protein [bacterium]MDB4483781.1 hypothetical protein [bacterium]
MWRAFFFAVGIMLIITGLECLVTQQFVIHGARVPNFVAAMLFDGPKDTNVTPSNDALRMAQGGYQAPRSTARNSGFGSSSFDDPYQTESNYRRQNGNQRSDFSLAGFGQRRTENAPMAAPKVKQQNQTTLIGPDKTGVFRPQDWLPWCLLAAGTLVVLYTNSLDPRA